MFFKELKQTLQLADFLGYNENAVRWQVWIALLAYLLLRFIAWFNKLRHQFWGLFTLARAAAGRVRGSAGKNIGRGGFWFRPGAE